MREIMVSQAQSCDLKELVQKFIPESIGREIEKATSSIYPLQNVFIRKVKILKAPKFDLGKLMEVSYYILSSLLGLWYILKKDECKSCPWWSHWSLWMLFILIECFVWWYVGSWRLLWRCWCENGEACWRADCWRNRSYWCLNESCFFHFFFYNILKLKQMQQMLVLW